jgi:hypothetical protein
MSAHKHDYDALEREFISNPDASIRGLCRAHGIKSYSSVAAYARSHGWYEKQRKLAARVEERAIEKVAERSSDVIAELLGEVQSEMLTVIRAALYKFAEDLKDPNYRIMPHDLIKLMNQGLLLMGEPTSRTEEKRLELTGTFEGLPPEFLRRLASATRPAIIERRAAPGAPSPGGPRARSN